MAKTPYLYRRNNIYYFRFVVPVELRETLKVREIIKSLKTQNREVAIPRKRLINSKSNKRRLSMTESPLSEATLTIA